MKVENMGRMMERKMGERGAFAFRCVQSDEQSGRAPQGRFSSHFEAARDWHAFLNKVHADRDLARSSQTWGVLAQRFGWDVPIDSSRVAARFFAHADAGSIKIGDMAGTCAVLLPNGYGDGVCEAVVMDRCREGELKHGGFNSCALNFLTSVSGTFQVYGYDCSPSRVGEDEPFLDGDYLVYYGGRKVLFVPMG